MATLLKDSPISPQTPATPDNRDNEAAPAGVLAASIDDTILGGQLPIPESGGGNPLPVPQRIIVRELTLAFGASGPFGFSKPDRYHTCTTLDDVYAMIGNIRHGTYDPRPDAQLYHRPLDLHLGANTCFIIRLDPAISWRFSRTEKGASLGKLEFPEDAENYFDLRHVWDNNIGQADPFPQHDRFCRLIYFIAKPVVGRPFNHAFNLNVEFVYPDGPGGAINTLPVVIDPDVRYPGGSGDS